MERIIVEVIVPGTGTSVDFDVPAQSRVRELTQDLIEILTLSEQNVLFDPVAPTLCDADRRCVLDRNAVLADSGIRDGSRLMVL